MSVGLSEIAHLILIFVKNPTELCRLLKIQRLTSSPAVSRETLHTAPSMEALYQRTNMRLTTGSQRFS